MQRIRMQGVVSGDSDDAVTTRRGYAAASSVQQVCRRSVSMRRPQAGTRDRPTPMSGLFDLPGGVCSYRGAGKPPIPFTPASRALGRRAGGFVISADAVESDGKRPNPRFRGLSPEKEGSRKPVQRDSRPLAGVRSWEISGLWRRRKRSSARRPEQERRAGRHGSPRTRHLLHDGQPVGACPRDRTD